MKTALALLALSTCALTYAASPSQTPSASAESTTFSPRSVYQLGFTWTDDKGKPVRLADLQGNAVVLTMFFSNCEYSCPMLVNDMKRLRDELSPEARAKSRFVLVTFDTDRDTPAALQRYRKRMQLDAGWTLLHGDANAVQELAMVLGIKYRASGDGQFSHSNLITVLDKKGEIAGQRVGMTGDVGELGKTVLESEKG
jgi:protein SCO1/2